MREWGQNVFLCNILCLLRKDQAFRLLSDISKYPQIHICPHIQFSCCIMHWTAISCGDQESVLKPLPTPPGKIGCTKSIKAVKIFLIQIFPNIFHQNISKYFSSRSFQIFFIHMFPNNFHPNISSRKDWMHQIYQSCESISHPNISKYFSSKYFQIICIQIFPPGKIGCIKSINAVKIFLIQIFPNICHPNISK